MALNYIWVGFFVIAFLVALAKLIFLGDTEIFKLLVEGLFDSSKSAVMDIALPLAGVMTFFLGLLNIAEKIGAINAIARVIGPFFNKLFPDVPKDHPANGQMIMNFSANMLGLDNAATPFGLKAMQSLQELNPDKETASDAQIMFLVLHTSGLTIIPLGIMAQRAILGGARFIASNKDRAYPVEGRLLPGAGSIVQALEVATERVAVCIGKPEPFLFEEAIRRAGADPGGSDPVVVVGDVPEYDIVAAHRVGEHEGGGKGPGNRDFGHPLPRTGRRVRRAHPRRGPAERLRLRARLVGSPRAEEGTQRSLRGQAEVLRVEGH